MGLRLTLPYPPDEPGPDVLGALPASAGKVLDSGRTWSDTGMGELVLTSLGLVACDLETLEMAGVGWASFDAGSQLSDLGTYASIAMHVEGCGTLSFGIDHRLAANIWAIASQLSEAGGGVEIEGVVTSPGISALIAPTSPAPPAPPAPPRRATSAATAVLAVDDAAVDLAGAPAHEWPPPIIDPTGDADADADAHADAEAEAEADPGFGVDAPPTAPVDEAAADTDASTGGRRSGEPAEWTTWRGEDESSLPAAPSPGAAHLGGARGRSLFDDNDTVRAPAPVGAGAAGMERLAPGGHLGTTDRFTAYAAAVEDEEEAPSHRRTWLLGGSVAAVALALAAAAMAFWPSGGDNDASVAAGATSTAASDRTGEQAGTRQSLGSEAATGAVSSGAAGAPQAPGTASTAATPASGASGTGVSVTAAAQTVPTVGTGRCHPAYLPCLPDLPGDALDCDDLTSGQKPVRLLDKTRDPYQLQGDDNSGVACPAT